MTTALLRVTAGETGAAEIPPRAAFPLQGQDVPSALRSAPSARPPKARPLPAPGARPAAAMENRKDLVMLVEGGQLGTLVGKIGANLSEAAGSPVQEPQGLMVHRSCASPRSVPDGEVGDARSGDISPRGHPSAAGKTHSEFRHKDHSSSDTESDFYEEIDVSCTPESMEYPNGKGEADILSGFYTELLTLENRDVLTRLCNE